MSSREKGKIGREEMGEKGGESRTKNCFEEQEAEKGGRM
jgi:hypothetical protein